MKAAALLAFAAPPSLAAALQATAVATNSSVEVSRSWEVRFETETEAQVLPLPPPAAAMRGRPDDDMTESAEFSQDRLDATAATAVVAVIASNFCRSISKVVDVNLASLFVLLDCAKLGGNSCGASLTAASRAFRFAVANTPIPADASL